MFRSSFCLIGPFLFEGSLKILDIKVMNISNHNMLIGVNRLKPTIIKHPVIDLDQVILELGTLHFSIQRYFFHVV